MEGLISSSQSAFIHGRNLGDSVLMLQELVQGYHKEDGVRRAAIKVDFQKAYDMVEWESLCVGMSDMGFPHMFIFLLQYCIIGARFSVNINDDLVLLTSTDLRSFRVFKETLGLFGELIGVRLNCDKSTIYRRAYRYGYMGMSEGVLPMRYLGIPLSSKGLTHEDYELFTRKICAKISSW
ncbi:hypothetical protein LIER_40041 [Lithospermum erythrorhizon]|uniref:Reverse transcriptase n=1 Tax=Lithospermum erythrorhizon TaxID=34254 RepID=A0AAV3QQ67_LITER